MRRAVATLTDLSAYYWALALASLVLGRLDPWSTLAGFAILLALRLSGRHRVPVATLVVKDASGLLFDVVDWGRASVVVRVRVRGEGGLRLFVSLSTLVYAASLLVALAVAKPPYVDPSRAAVLLATFALSVLFYRSVSTYVRAVGASVIVSRAVAYATLVSLLLWLTIGGTESLVLSSLLNLLATILGCDVMTLKWAVLSNAKTLTIGGLGLYDAVIAIPMVSYLLSSLLVATAGVLG